jgi:hypothetical protein
MPQRSSKEPKDINQLAFDIVEELTSDKPREQPPEKNPAAVELGRLGGLKGGKARAIKLSPKRRRAIASHAAKTRWAARRRAE